MYSVDYYTTGSVSRKIENYNTKEEAEARRNELLEQGLTDNSEILVLSPEDQAP